MLGRRTSRNLVLVGMLACVSCLTYFYLLDRVFFSSAPFAPIFRVLLTLDDINTAWLAVGVCVLAALWHRPEPVLNAVDLLGSHPLKAPAISVVVLSICCLTVYHNYPLCMDEYAAVFQAKIFAAGHLYATLPASVIDWLVVPGFNGKFLFASRETGRAIETYWPGFALLLAPFELIGISWLCNSLLAGFALYLIFQITFIITKDRRAAGWAVLFSMSSGAFVAYAISYYSMQAHLTANLLFAYLLMNPAPRRALGAGLVGSLALVLHNPFPHTLFAAPWIVALALDESRRRSFVLLMLGYGPGLCIGAAWLMLRGHLGPPNHNLWAAIGVGGGVFTLPGLELVNMRAASFVKLWVWATPCLFLFAFLGWRSCRDNLYARLLTYSAAGTIVGYLFVGLDQGHGWGYRYFHSAWGVIPILAGCGMVDHRSPPRLIAFAGAASILSLALIVPFQLHQIDGFISRHLAQLPAPKRPGNNVIFVPPGAGSYMADMIQIDPFLRSPDLVLASRGALLDGELIRQNWPAAARLGNRSSAQQWYLGPTDLRRMDTAGDKHFTLVYEALDRHQ